MIQYHWKGRRYNVTSQTYNDYVDLHPIYGDKLSIKHSMPDNERYYKESFNGTLKFVRDDYSWIMDAVDGLTRFNTIYELELWTQTQQVTTLKFVITDCEVDEDNGIITVKPTTKMKYDELLDGLDREFNLIDLNPKIEQVKWYKRAVLQTYRSGDNALTNFVGSTHWEQEANENGQSVTSDYYFATCGLVAKVIISESPSHQYDDTFVGKIPVSTAEYDVRLLPLRVEDTNYIRVQRFWDSGNDVYRVNMSFHEQGGTQIALFYQDIGGFPDSYSAYVQNIGLFTESAMRIYGRILSDKWINSNTVTRPNPDIVTYNKNYKYVTPYNKDCLGVSTRQTTTPNQYPTNTERVEFYYLPPTDSPKWLPIQQSEWDGDVSFWYDMEEGYFDDSQARKAMSLRHAYPLYSAIKVLLAQIAPDLSFDGTTAYSEFLFDYDSETHPLAQDMVHLFITPKTNILNGDYKTPAYNAPVKLKEILDMLKAVYKCYWFIDSDNKLRIEHVSWFMNGGTYDNPSQTISYDLTTLKNTRNMKAWAFDKNKYTFDKPNMPATYTFAWMDEVTQEFKGYQMEMQSQLVDKGKNEEINVGKFTSDIDFVTISPDDISKDGFMLLGATYKNYAYYLPFYPLIIEGTNITNYLQNGFLAYVYLEKNKIWLTDLPADVKYSDGTTGTVSMKSRMKQQDVTVPMTTPIFNPITLIKTGIGKGEIKDIEINISSLTAKAKLKYDTQ